MKEEIMDICVCSPCEDGEVISHLEYNVRTAQKHHFCYECHEAILPGQKYEEATGFWEHGRFRHKTCMSCKAVRDSVMECGFCFEHLWEDIFIALDQTTDYKKNPEAGSEILAVMPQYWRTNEIEARMRLQPNPPGP
jgi:hypothetical protein